MNPDQLTRVLDGRRQRARGESFELALDGQHQAYLRQGMADVKRVPTPAKVLGPTKRDGRGRTTFPACWAAKASADFEGVLRGGRNVRIEAKRREHDRIGIADVQPQQTADLARCHDFGGLALVVIRLEVDGAPEGGTWVLQASQLWARPQGPRTWTPRHLDELGLRLVGVDWLRAAAGAGWCDLGQGEPACGST